MQFRIVLPVISVVLGVFLFHWGDIQVRKAVVSASGAVEGMPDIAATAKYAHYALNAPAWALDDQREMRWSPTTYWTGHDLQYFVAVILMWYLIGLNLDRRTRRNKQDSGSRRAQWYRILTGTGLLLYGIFLCYRLVPEWRSLAALKEWAFAVARLDYGWWFVVAGETWGVGMILAGLHSLISKRATPNPLPSQRL